MVCVKMTYFHRFFRTIPGVLVIVIVIVTNMIRLLVVNLNMIFFPHSRPEHQDQQQGSNQGRKNNDLIEQ